MFLAMFHNALYYHAGAGGVLPSIQIGSAQGVRSAVQSPVHDGDFAENTGYGSSWSVTIAPTKAGGHGVFTVKSEPGRSNLLSRRLIFQLSSVEFFFICSTFIELRKKLGLHAGEV